KGFDYKKTKCETGVLGTAALKRDDFKRSRHPMYSFAVWGKDKDYLCNMNNISSFGSDSPFAYLHHNNAVDVLIDVNYNNSFTFTHYVEETVGLPVPYRFHKIFSDLYVDEMGFKEQREYSMFVRSYELNTTNNMTLGETLENSGVSNKYDFMGVTVRVLRLGDCYPFLKQDILENRSRNLCCYIGQ
ncbi:MAG: AAC(3) family N-acetyltransferase, partial [Clostridiales bacterium]|nr:AAC(3) family N-acetyltransferase [Clostridiales bacterium]